MIPFEFYLISMNFKDFSMTSQSFLSLFSINGIPGYKSGGNPEWTWKPVNIVLEQRNFPELWKYFIWVSTIKTNVHSP